MDRSIDGFKKDWIYYGWIKWINGWTNEWLDVNEVLRWMNYK